MSSVFCNNNFFFRWTVWRDSRVVEFNDKTCQEKKIGPSYSKFCNEGRADCTF